MPRCVAAIVIVPNAERKVTGVNANELNTGHDDVMASLPQRTDRPLEHRVAHQDVVGVVCPDGENRNTCVRERRRELYENADEFRRECPFDPDDGIRSFGLHVIWHPVGGTHDRKLGSRAGDRDEAGAISPSRNWLGGVEATHGDAFSAHLEAEVMPARCSRHGVRSG
jgi:hypothetical protein